MSSFTPMEDQMKNALQQMLEQLSEMRPNDPLVAAALGDAHYALNNAILLIKRQKSPDHEA